MRSAVRRALVCATILIASAADAAELAPASYTAAAPVRAYSWTGPYLGANVGYQWGYAAREPARPSGIAGGIQGGYNWQTGRFVFGGEADLQLSAAADTFAPWKFANPWFGTARARAGVALNSILLYATLGLAFGDIRLETVGLSETKTVLGWTAGAGIELALTQNWLTRVEYLYVDLSQRNVALSGAAHGIESHLLRLGVNYRF